MAVPEQIPVVNYVADGIVKKFDVPFEYDQQSDLHVYVDGAEPTIDKYFFADNSFNFYIAPTVGQDVKIKRITPKERDTDYNLHTNTVRPKALNTDFDRLWYVLQEVFSDVGGLSQTVQDEIIARIQGDEDLLNQLTAEISARMLGDEAVTEDLKNYVNQVVGAIINDPDFDGIDADKVNDASGETQQQVNYNGGSKWHSRVGGYLENERVILTNGDIVKSTIDGNVNDPNVNMTGWENASKQAAKFLSARDVGLTKWEEFKKPPYSVSEYQQAYDNGVNISSAIQAANISGYSEVVLEKGNYPFLYPNLTGSTNNGILVGTGTIGLDGLDGITVNFGGSTLFVIFDSTTKNPYDKSASSYLPYNLAGTLLRIRNSRGVCFKNGLLRGDSYNRAWVSGEQQTEQTYGVQCGYNNRHIEFLNMKFTGFRGDGITGHARGNPDLKVGDLTTWTAGDLDLTTGAVVAKVGAYHSDKVSLAGKTIIDNMVQIMSLAARKIAFRSSYLNVLFFDVSNNVLGFTRTQQAADITLLPNTAYIQFVAYDDERTTQTVTYNSLWYGIQVHTGMSYGFYVGQDCEFYENHRGGISNLGGGLKVFGATFKNSGRLSKLGFPAFSFTTQYGINLEDTYINDLFIDRVLMDNVPIPVLSNNRNLTLTNSILKNSYYGGVGIFGASYVNISGNIFENIGINSAGEQQYTGIEYLPQTLSDTFVSDIRIENNTLLYTHVSLGVAKNPKIKLRVANNYSYRGKFIVYGNASTTVESNTLTEFAGTGNTNRGVYISAGVVKGNLIHGKPVDSPATAPFTTMTSEVLSDSNVVIVEGETIISDVLAPNSTVNIGGVFKAATRTPLRMNAKAFNVDTHNSTQDSVFVRDSIFENVDLQFYGATSSASYPKLLVNFSNCSFKDVLFDNRVRLSTSDVAVELVFTNCDFDVTNLTNLIKSRNYPTRINATFIDCVFKSATSRSIALLDGADVYATEQGARFINITNTSANFTSVGVVKVVYDPPSLANGVQQSTTVTLAGAKVGDNINVSFDKPLSGTRMWGEVTSTNTVTVYHRNDTGAVVDIPSGTLMVKLI